MIQTLLSPVLRYFDYPLEQGLRRTYIRFLPHRYKGILIIH